MNLHGLIASFALLIAVGSFAADRNSGSIEADAAASLNAWQAEGPLERADDKAIRRLLAELRYPDLEEQLDQYFRASQADPLKEDALIGAYKAFSVADSSLYDAIDAWVVKRPSSAAALIARAYCAAQMGWSLRGTKFARDTSSAQVAQMLKAHDMARVDARAALQMLPHPAAYRLLIQISRNQGPAAVYQVGETAIAAFPTSLSLWTNLIDARTVAWGGAEGEVAEIAQSAQRHAKTNPRLRTLLGRADFYKADRIQRQGRLEEAFELYSRAITHGDDDEFLMARARLARKLGLFDQARKDVTRAMTVFPDASDRTLASLLESIDAEEAAFTAGVRRQH